MRPIRVLLYLLPVFALINPVHAADYGPVKTGDSLWLIAKDHRPASNITINQMMIATFRKNPDAFGGNINWLYVDRTLALPAAAEAHAIPAAEADAEVIRQNNAWKNAVDRFVSAGGNRRQQLDVVLSGQSSDDPEIRALREELRLLVAGLREERELLREQRESEARPLQEAERFFDGNRWALAPVFGYSLMSPVVNSRARPEDNVHFQYLSSEFDSSGSLLSIGLHAQRPLWGSLEGYRLTFGAEYTLLGGRGEISMTYNHPTNSAGIPAGSYDSRVRRDADVSLLRLPILLDTVAFVSGKTEFIAGGGIVVNHTMGVDTTFRSELTNLATGVTTVESGASHPLYKDLTAEGISFDLRLLAGAQWMPEWTGNRPLWVALELEQSIGDAFGGTEAQNNLIQFEKSRFQLKAGLAF